MELDFIRLIDYIGTFAFAISGIRLAAAKNFDIFGAYVVGFVTAVGGGTLRDLMLDVTPFWMEQPSYVIITGLALLFVIIFRKYVVRFDNTFFIFDAIGIGLFTVVGVERSIAAGFPVWVNIIMGAITGAAGGMVRDVLINEVPLIFRKDIYAVACVLGGVAYYICVLLGCSHLATQIIAALTVILTRILSVHFCVSLPALRSIE
ncbi:MAG: trimeric intracellular cation channel family protein [Bacteroidales bacterium]|nr:trimeric intracellular cation channel family protein [Bacteroidales bacterium]MDE7127547.1 trimeric intracellular cation channel family protein [Bacteroidales bacterium]